MLAGRWDLEFWSPSDFSELLPLRKSNMCNFSKKAIKSFPNNHYGSKQISLPVCPPNTAVSQVRAEHCWPREHGGWGPEDCVASDYGLYVKLLFACGWILSPPTGPLSCGSEVVHLCSFTGYVTFLPARSHGVVLTGKYKFLLE